MIQRPKPLTSAIGPLHHQFVNSPKQITNVKSLKSAPLHRLALYQKGEKVDNNCPVRPICQDIFPARMYVTILTKVSKVPSRSFHDATKYLRSRYLILLS